jgi:hypothetical protein
MVRSRISIRLAPEYHPIEIAHRKCQIAIFVSDSRWLTRAQCKVLINRVAARLIFMLGGNLSSSQAVSTDTRSQQKHLQLRNR